MSTYLRMTGVSPGRAQTNDAAAFATTDLDVRIELSLDNWASANHVLCGQMNSAGTQWAWQMFWANAGFFRLQYSTGGTSATLVTANQSNTANIANGATQWLRITRVAATGLISYYTSSDGVSWTAKGTATHGTGTIFNSNTPLEVGASMGGGSGAVGNIKRFVMLSGIDGTPVASPDFTTQTPGATGFIDPQGNVWSITGPASIAGTVDIVKPAAGTGIDVGNAFAANLKWASLFNEGTGTTTGDATGNGVALTLQGTAAWITDAEGTGLDLLGSGRGAQVTTPTALKLTLPISIVLRCRTRGTPTSYSDFFGLTHNNTDSSPYGAAMFGNNTGHLRTLTNSAGTLSSLLPTSPLSNTGSIATIGLTYTTAGILFYRDGILIASSSASYSNPTYGATSLLFVGNHTPLNRSSAITAHMGAIWQRELSGADHAAIHGNPYQMFGGTVTPTTSLLLRRRRAA